MAAKLLLNELIPFVVGSRLAGIPLSSDHSLCVTPLPA